jgi:TP901 family phage tail tape measure protein
MFDFSIKLKALDNITPKIEAINTKLSKLKNKVGEKISVNVESKKAISRLNGLQNKIRDLSKQPIDIGLSIASLVSNIALLGIPINKAIEFEKTFAGVKKVVTGTDAEINKLKNDLINMTSVIPRTATELTQIAEAGAKMGIPIAQLTEYTDVVAKASTAFDFTNAEEASQAFGKISSQLGYSIPQLRQYGDVVNSLADSMATDAKNIIDITKRTAGVMGTLKFDIGTVAGLSAFADQMSVSSEVGATALNQVLEGIRGTEKGLKILQEKGGYGLIEIANKFKKLKGTVRTKAIEDMFGKGEGARMFEKLINQTGVLEKALNTALSTDTIGSMQREFENVSNTTANKLIIMRNGFDRLALKIGDVFLPKVNELVTMIAPLIDKMAEWAERNRDTIITIGKILAVSIALVGGFLLIKTMLVPVILAIKTYMLVMQGLSMALGVAKVAMFLFNAVFLANPIGLVVLAVTALVAGVGYLVGGIDGAKQAFLNLISPITLILDLIDNLLSKLDIYNSLKDGIKDVSATVTKGVAGAWEGAKSLFSFSGEENKPVDNTSTTELTANINVSGTNAQVDNVKSTGAGVVNLNNATQR